MTTGTQPHRIDETDYPLGGDPELSKLVCQELDHIMASRFFKNSQRSRQFLEHIVHRKLEGQTDTLKERSIGTELYQRLPNYATGEDPVVRVQAGEVRRRLEQYYQAQTEPPTVRIELPVGSYAPHFRWRASEPEPKSEDRSKSAAEPAANRLRSRVLILSSLAVLCAAVVAGVGIAWTNARHPVPPPSKIEQFWAPALASQQPLLICLAKPVVYRPTLELYRRYSSQHRDTFQTEVERSNRELPLDPNTRLVWSEMMDYPDYGVALGDVEAAVSLSALLGKLGKPTQLRIGDHYSFEDLRKSPSVLVGAFNNRWTMQITPGLHFEFVEDNGQFTIRERGPNGRVWHATYGQSLRAGEDFLMVARLLDSSTGQFTVVAAGISGSGTQAAGDFISNPGLLEKALSGLPDGWQKKNVEFVLETTVTDAVAGPPRVVASYTW